MLNLKRSHRRDPGKIWTLAEYWTVQRGRSDGGIARSPVASQAERESGVRASAWLNLMGEGPDSVGGSSVCFTRLANPAPSGRRRPSPLLAAVASSPFARRRGSRAPEGLCKVALVGKPQSYRDVNEAECSVQQERLRVLHAGIQEPAIGRDAHGRFESARKL